MAGLFVNLSPPTAGNLPAMLALPFKHDLYYGRLIHAECDHYNAPLSRRTEVFEHDHFHVILINSGHSTFNIDGEEVPAEAGDVFFTSPLVRHNFLNIGDGDARYTEVTFQFINRRGRVLAVRFDQLLAKWTNQPCRDVTRAKASRTFSRAFQTLVDGIVTHRRSADPNDDIDQSAALWQILRLTYEHFHRPPAPRPTEPMAVVRDHVQSHYRDELSLASLAEMIGVTPNYLSRRFKQAFGKTPIDFQIDLRMQEACALLLAGDQTLERIASAVGFQDAYYFGRLFKKRMGISPGRYRNGV